MSLNKSLVQENMKIREAYTKYEEWYNKNKAQILKETKQTLGEEIDYKINMPINTMTKPP